MYTHHQDYKMLQIHHTPITRHYLTISLNGLLCYAYILYLCQGDNNMPALPWFITTILGACIFGLGGFFIRLGSTRHQDAGILTLLGLYTTGTICFLLFAQVQGTLAISIALVGWGIAVSLGSVLGNQFWVQAFRYGPSSLSGPLINTYNILIILMSVIFFGESLSITEMMAIGLILVSVSLITYDPNENFRVNNRIWYILIVLAILAFFMRNGGLKITEEQSLDNTMILAVAYMVGIIWFSVRLSNHRELITRPLLGFSLGWGLVAGVCSFSGMQLFAYSIEHGPASIVAPVFSMNGLVFALLTIIFLGERLSRFQILALFICIAGLVLVQL